MSQRHLSCLCLHDTLTLGFFFWTLPRFLFCSDLGDVHCSSCFTALDSVCGFHGLPWLDTKGPGILCLSQLCFHPPICIPVLLELHSWDIIGQWISVNSCGSFSKEKIRMSLRCPVTIMGQDQAGVPYYVFTCVFSNWEDLCELNVKILNVEWSDVCSKTSTKITKLKGLSISDRIKWFVNISVVNKVAGVPLLWNISKYKSWA